MAPMLRGATVLTGKGAQQLTINQREERDFVGQCKKKNDEGFEQHNEE